MSIASMAAHSANMAAAALDNNNGIVGGGDQSQNSFEQLCQVALHEKQACVNAAESLAGDNNIVMVLAPPPPPKVINNDVDHRGHVTQNYLDKIRSHCNNVTLYVKSENGSPSNNYQEGTIREIRSRSRKDSRDSFCEAFQSSASAMSLNSEQRSPTFPQQYRKTRDFIPEDLKDEGYWIKRKKNNEAAKRSREKRRNNDAAIEAKVNLLQQMNDKLVAENNDLKKSLAEANEKIQYLQTERALKIANPMPSTFNLEHVGKLTSATSNNLSAQSTPFFYIPQGASNPNHTGGPDPQLEQLQAQNGAGASVCGVGARNQNLSMVQSQAMSQNFNLDQSCSNHSSAVATAAVLPSASSIMQQSIHRKNLTSGSSVGTGSVAANATALGQHGANSIILPLQSISAALGPAVQQAAAAVAPSQNPVLSQNSNMPAGSVVYLNTGASVVPINATLVQAASVSSASLLPQGITAALPPHHSQSVVAAAASANQNTAAVVCSAAAAADIQQSASVAAAAAATTTSGQPPSKLLAQGQPVLKPASLVSLSTPIDNIIPLKKRFKDSNSPQNCGVSNPIQTSPPVGVAVATHHRKGGNLAPSSTFILHSDSSGEFNQETGESNSNPEYWKTQLITIMSEVERLKHQMGSIQQSSTSSCSPGVSVSGVSSSPAMSGHQPQQSLGSSPSQQQHTPTMVASPSGGSGGGPGVGHPGTGPAVASAGGGTPNHLHHHHHHHHHHQQQSQPPAPSIAPPPPGSLNAAAHPPVPSIVTQHCSHHSQQKPQPLEMSPIPVSCGGAPAPNSSGSGCPPPPLSHPQYVVTSSVAISMNTNTSTPHCSSVGGSNAPTPSPATASGPVPSLSSTTGDVVSTESPHRMTQPQDS